MDICIENKVFNTSNLEAIKEYVFEKVGESTFSLNLINFIHEWFDENDFISCQTSGSTGEKKWIKIEKTKAILSAKSTLDFLQIREKTNALLCLDPQFIAGKMMVIRAIVGKLNLVLQEPKVNLTEHFNTDIEIELCAMMPYQFTQFIEDGKLNYLQKMKTILLGGMQVTLSNYNLKALTNTRIFESFGMTETVSHFALKEIHPSAKTAFKCLNGIEIKTNEDSTLTIKGEITEQEWIKTNDLVELQSSQNEFIWKGRTDNVINIGGIKISPEEVESEILKHISTAFFREKNWIISSKEDSTFEHKLILIIESKEKYDVNLEVFSFLEKRKRPKQINFLAEFERTENGKIQRAKTRELLLITL